MNYPTGEIQQKTQGNMDMAGSSGASGSGADFVAALFRDGLSNPGWPPDTDTYHKRNRPGSNSGRGRCASGTEEICTGTDGG